MECSSPLSLTLYFHQCIDLEINLGLLTMRKIIFWNMKIFHFLFLFLCPHPLKGTWTQKIMWSLLGLLGIYEFKYPRCASKHKICTFPEKKKSNKHKPKKRWKLILPALSSSEPQVWASAVYFCWSFVTGSNDSYFIIKIYPTIQPRAKEKVICCHLQIYISSKTLVYIYKLHICESVGLPIC